jgi:hypothetical protein
VLFYHSFMSWTKCRSCGFTGSCLILNALGFPIFSPQVHQEENKQSIPKHKLHLPHNIHYHQNTPSTSQTCPKVVPDVTTIIVPNAILVDADGSTNLYVTALPTPTSVRSTICLTRLISVVVCVRVSKMLLREHSENNRSVLRPLAIHKMRNDETRKVRARSSKAGRRDELNTTFELS